MAWNYFDGGVNPVAARLAADRARREAAAAAAAEAAAAARRAEAQRQAQQRALNLAAALRARERATQAAQQEEAARETRRLQGQMAVRQLTAEREAAVTAAENARETRRLQGQMAVRQLTVERDAAIAAAVAERDRASDDMREMRRMITLSSPPPARLPQETAAETATRRAAEDARTASQDRHLDGLTARRDLASAQEALARGVRAGAPEATLAELRNEVTLRTEARRDADRAAQLASTELGLQDTLADSSDRVRRLRVDIAAGEAQDGSAAQATVELDRQELALAEQQRDTAQQAVTDARGLIDSTQWLDNELPAQAADLEARITEFNGLGGPTSQAEYLRRVETSKRLERELAALQRDTEAHQAEVLRAGEALGTPGVAADTALVEVRVVIGQWGAERARDALSSIDRQADPQGYAATLSMLQRAEIGTAADAQLLAGRRGEDELQRLALEAAQQTQTPLQVVDNGGLPMDPYAEAATVDQSVINNGRLWLDNRDMAYVDLPDDYNPIQGLRPPGLADPASADARYVPMGNDGRAWEVTPAVAPTVLGRAVTDIVVQGQANGEYTVSYTIEGMRFTDKRMSDIDSRLWEGDYRQAQGARASDAANADLALRAQANDNAIDQVLLPQAEGTAPRSPQSDALATRLVDALAADREATDPAALATLQTDYAAAWSADLSADLPAAQAALNRRHYELAPPGSFYAPDRLDEWLAPERARVEAALNAPALALQARQAAFDATHPILDPQRFDEQMRAQFEANAEDLGRLQIENWEAVHPDSSTEINNRDEAREFVRRMLADRQPSDEDVDRIVDGLYHQGLFQGRPDWEGPLRVEASPVIYGADGGTAANVVFRVDQDNVAGVRRNAYELPSPPGQWSMLVDIDGQTYSDERDYRENNRTMEAPGTHWSVMFGEGQRDGADALDNLSVGDSRVEGWYEKFQRENPWVEPVAITALTVGGIALTATGVGAPAGAGALATAAGTAARGAAILSRLNAGVRVAGVGLGAAYGGRAAWNRAQASAHNRSQTDREAVLDWFGMAAMPIGFSQIAASSKGLQLMQAGHTVRGATVIGLPTAANAAPLPLMASDMWNPQLSDAQRGAARVNFFANVLGLGHGAHFAATYRPAPRAAAASGSAGHAPLRSGDANEPLGARGPVSGREFDPDNAGGPILELSVRRPNSDPTEPFPRGQITINRRGVEVVEQHIARFGPDAANETMLLRLRAIADESDAPVAQRRIAPTDEDLNFYAHELREAVRYRKLGYGLGDPLPTDKDAQATLWENAHAAALEDYRLHEKAPGGGRTLYHPDAARLLGLDPAAANPAQPLGARSGQPAAASSPPPARVVRAAVGGVVLTGALAGGSFAAAGAVPLTAALTGVAAGTLFRALLKTSRYSNAQHWDRPHRTLTQLLAPKGEFETAANRLIAARQRATASTPQRDAFDAAMKVLTELQPQQRTGAGRSLEGQRAYAQRIERAVLNLATAARDLGIAPATVNRATRTMLFRVKDKAQFDRALYRYDGLVDHLTGGVRGVEPSRQRELRAQLDVLVAAEQKLRNADPASDAAALKALEGGLQQLTALGADLRPLGSKVRTAIDGAQFLTYGTALGALLRNVAEGEVPAGVAAPLVVGAFAVANSADAVRIAGLLVDRVRNPGAASVAESALFKKVLPAADDGLSFAAGAAVAGLAVKNGLPTPDAQQAARIVGTVLYGATSGAQFAEGVRRRFDDPTAQQRGAYVKSRIAAGAGAAGLVVASQLAEGLFEAEDAKTAGELSPPKPTPTNGPDTGPQNPPRRPIDPPDVPVTPLQNIVLADGQKVATAGSLWAIASHHVNWILTPHERAALGGPVAIEHAATLRLIDKNGFDRRLMDGEVTADPRDPDRLPVGRAIDVNVLQLLRAPPTDR